MNFIGIWIKMLDENYDAIRLPYITSMKEMFKQIPTMMTNHLFQDKNNRNLLQKLVVDGIWKIL